MSSMDWESLVLFFSVCLLGAKGVVDSGFTSSSAVHSLLALVRTRNVHVAKAMDGM